MPTRDTNASAGSINSLIDYSAAFSPLTGGRYSGGSITGPSYGYWWSATSSSTTARYYLRWYNNALTVPTSGYSRYLGNYVRCVRGTSIKDVEYMQDFKTMSSTELAAVKSSMATGVQYKLVDNRDGKSYFVAKQADGNIWMTQNLDLCIGCTGTATLTSENTDLNTSGSGAYSSGYTTSNGVITWTPSSSSVTSASDWVDNGTAPTSAELGDKYAYTSGSSNDDTYYSSLSSCVNGGHTEDECQHYHIGNYYNWPAAIASNNITSITTNYSVAANSICPAGWRLPKIASGSSASATTREVSQLLYTSGVIASLTAQTYTTNGYVLLRASPLYIINAGAIAGGSWGGVGYNGRYWGSTFWQVSNNERTVWDLSWAIDHNIYSGSMTGITSSAGSSLHCLAR